MKPACPPHQLDEPDAVDRAAGFDVGTPDHFVRFLEGRRATRRTYAHEGDVVVDGLGYADDRGGALDAPQHFVECVAPRCVPSPPTHSKISIPAACRKSAITARAPARPRELPSTVPPSLSMSSA